MPTGCGSTFNLAAYGQPGDSCSLNLAITNAVEANDQISTTTYLSVFQEASLVQEHHFSLDVSVLSNIGVSGINALAILIQLFSGGLNSSNKGSMWGLNSVLGYYL